MVELSYGTVIVNHPESMKRGPEVRKCIELAVTAKTGIKASLT